jgi:glyoxylase-like metal-dependent hydrolase (beta-lactamase superfamily II)
LNAHLLAKSIHASQYKLIPRHPNVPTLQYILPVVYNARVTASHTSARKALAHCAANLVALLLFSASSVLGQGETAKITDGVYAFNLGAVELPYTSMFVVTGYGVMVVYPINSNSARVMLQEIRKITNEPIRYVFYSHDHWDHTSGGQVFKNEGAEIIAHTDANEWIKTHTGADQIPADSSWSGSQKEYSLGRFTMVLHQFGPSHGNGMTIFVVNSEPRVFYIADLAAVKSTGPVYLPEFDTKGWENTLEHSRKDTPVELWKGCFYPFPSSGRHQARSG